MSGPPDFIQRFQALVDEVKSTETLLKDGGNTADVVVKITTIREGIKSLMRIFLSDRVVSLQKVQDLEGEVVKWDSSSTFLADDLNETQSALEKSNAARSDLQKELQNLKKAMDALQASYTEACETILLRDEDLSKAIQKIADMKISRREDRKKSEDDLASRLNAMEQQMKEVQEELRTSTSSTAQEIEELRTSNQELRTSTSSTAQEIEELRTRVEKLEFRANAIDIRQCLRSMEHFMTVSILPESDGLFISLGKDREDQVTTLQTAYRNFTIKHLDLYYVLKQRGNVATHQEIEITSKETFMNTLKSRFTLNETETKLGHDFAEWIDNLCSNNERSFGDF